MYADDSNLFKSDKDIKKLFSEMNNELENVAIWFKANKLSLNIKKTKFSLFHAPQKKRFIPSTLPKIVIEKHEITRDRVTKFLGIFLDENITWKTHISHITNKISKSIGILYKSRYLLNKKLLKLLYYAFVQSHINYGIAAWGSTHNYKLKPLYRKQKHAIRVINYKDKYEPSKPLFYNMSILNIYQLNLLDILCFMYKSKMEECPNIFHDIFKLKPQNKYSKRRKHILSEPFCKTKTEQFTVAYRGPHIWNKILTIDNDIGSIKSYPSFKKSIKRIILSNENLIHDIF